MIERLPRSLIYALQRGQHLWSRLARPLTIGVRALVIDPGNRVFLVRHSYDPGWHLPGGGVEPGETTAEALVRELREEGNLVVEGTPQVHGIFLNTYATRRDHVVVYLVRDFHQTGPRGADWEIVETGFFPFEGLPETTARATRARIGEFLAGSVPSELW